MFQHQGTSRTQNHNLSIASLLSFVAGLVNIAGFLSIQKLTTNVTGHFAFFVDEVFKLDYFLAFIYFLYIFSFLLGSFLSSFLIELISSKGDRNIYVIPTIIESIILILVALFGKRLLIKNEDLLAFSLLFAMGLQNALVTKISNATVRTTHLTGLFTDLGIELSQLFFYKHKKQHHQLFSSIKLRITIISCFFFGGILGGVFYSLLELNILLIAALTLIIGLLIDQVNGRKHINQIHTS